MHWGITASLYHCHDFGYWVAPQSAGSVRYTEANAIPPSRHCGAPQRQKELYGFTAART